MMQMYRTGDVVKLNNVGGKVWSDYMIEKFAGKIVKIRKENGEGFEICGEPFTFLIEDIVCKVGEKDV